MQSSNYAQHTPQEQCEYHAQDGLKLNLHKVTDLFIHTTHTYSGNRKVRFAPEHPRHGSCKTCYTTRCLDEGCWNPADHAAILEKHPELMRKERRDQFLVESAQAKAANRVLNDHEVYQDYFSASDEADESSEGSDIEMSVSGSSNNEKQETGLSDTNETDDRVVENSPDTGESMDDETGLEVGKSQQTDVEMVGGGAPTNGEDATAGSSFADSTCAEADHLQELSGKYVLPKLLSLHPRGDCSDVRDL